jgi:hypothetical protein
MSLSHLKITQAGLVGLLTTIVGQVVAFVPSFAPDKQILISAGSAVIATGFMLANGLHKLADSNVSTKDVEAGAVAAAKDELAKVDLNKMVADPVSANGVPDLEAKVRAEAQAAVQSLIARLGQPDPLPAPATPAAPVV